MPAKRAHIQTFGCQMNEHDSQRMAKILESAGYEMTDDPAQAQVVLVNTCSVRENPENKVYSLLGRLRRLKKNGARVIIGVAGCVAQQEGEAILNREKCVDLVFGPDNYFDLPDMIAAAERGERVLNTEWLSGRRKVRNFIPEERMEQVALEGCKGYIAITKGCDNFCSFCIVPYTRGREVSRERDNILREARTMLERGAREIWLLGQNVNSYTADGAGFYELLDAVSRLDGLLRLRFTSPHPNDWNNRLSDLMAERKTICNHLHLPFQAGGNRILTLMRRRHTIEDYLEKVRYMRAINPRLEISTDIIVGFPTETDEEFAWTLRVMEEVRFSQVFAFKYSVRPGTRAAGMEDDVPRGLKEERLARVLELQERITGEQLHALAGSRHDVLIDGAHLRQQGVMNGRTEGFRPVSVPGDDIEIGDLVQVRITGCRNHWLEAERLVNRSASAR
ncbi:MAG TPA: tRNA (N6-isopentenyl adenosine(37)-C2)-methylthiotransferase MiaB [Candidatus Hydrogenedentes bacterium]|nr:tRNA (N6-isopentenyl adenosine(37)-C2)-methylthiotransferase MiaB [Candidatus Hydrogenedentota bacterium]HPV39340.1 tRNA (N6-isopentenyl adenosine(37)-C2)-methylthiotransferase MiaB [Candidatus Hydrogenedentota bacterium]HQE75985.1 tRNA (N6-isopentenyl adenosine(37)-C2)-methylthiotransferase MiaB [Candidatus Hydrogenedentota bacterium]HQH67212.1 tRNA (N6-isopentenyl adenosine(37)-C2)-methylthiotransferase MiaB [Candidatus Hydrogenedentota bacterium]